MPFVKEVVEVVLVVVGESSSLRKWVAGDKHFGERTLRELGSEMGSQSSSMGSGSEGMCPSLTSIVHYLCHVDQLTSLFQALVSTFAKWS